MSPTAVTFAGNNLQTAPSNGGIGILVGDIDHESIPTKNAKLYEISHASNSSIPFVSYPSKPIKLKGTIITSSKQAQEALTDSFKSYFNTTSGQLAISYNGSTRIYYATVSKLPVVRPLGTTRSDFEVDLDATPPWGYDPFTTNLFTATYSGLTNSYSTPGLTISGSAPWQAPIATITLQTISGALSVAGTVSYGNAYTGQQANVTRTWSNGDVAIFDPTLNQVLINGVQTQFTGAIPKFQSGILATATYADTFGNRSFNMALAYIVRYL